MVGRDETLGTYPSAWWDTPVNPFHTEEGGILWSWLTHALCRFAAVTRAPLFFWRWEGDLDFAAFTRGVKAKGLLSRPNVAFVDAFDEAREAPLRWGGTVIYNATGGVSIARYQDGVAVKVATTDEDVIKKIEALIKDLGGVSSAVAKPGACSMLITRHGHLTIAPLSKRIGRAFVAENYDEAVVAAWRQGCEDLVSPDPVGRLTIVSGPPGCGKTYLVRGWIDAVRAEFVYVPASMVAQIQGPQLMSVFLSRREEEGVGDRPIVLVVEDADELLIQRQVDNLGSLSALLNLAAGIPGDAIDVRIVATTNAEKLKFDPAVLRTGRLSQHIEVPLLSAWQADGVLRRLGGGEHNFTASMSLADVYRRARTKIKEGAA